MLVCHSTPPKFLHFFYISINPIAKHLFSEFLPFSLPVFSCFSLLCSPLALVIYSYHARCSVFKRGWICHYPHVSVPNPYEIHQITCLWAGDSLSFHDKSPFSTWDHDHWFPYFEYCASKFHGAWWYNGCLQSNLNGDYKHNSSAPDSDGISWATHYGSLYSMRFTEMKFRPQ